MTSRIRRINIIIHAKQCVYFILPVYIFTCSIWVHLVFIFWVQVATPPEAMQINDDVWFCVVRAYNKCASPFYVYIVFIVHRDIDTHHQGRFLFIVFTLLFYFRELGWSTKKTHQFCIKRLNMVFGDITIIW